MRKVEKYYPLVASLIAGLVAMCIFLRYPSLRVPAKELLKSEFLSVIVTIETTLFGFLLAILAILLQLKGPVMNRIKKWNRFSELVSYSKSAVMSCALTLMFATMLILWSKWIEGYDNQYLIVTLWSTTLAYNILATYRFVSIFYVIAKSS